MTGFDIQQYEYTKEKAGFLNISLVPKGKGIELLKTNIKTNIKLTLGVFPNVSDVNFYLCGYEVGIQSLENIS